MESPIKSNCKILFVFFKSWLYCSSPQCADTVNIWLKPHFNKCHANEKQKQDKYTTCIFNEI